MSCRSMSMFCNGVHVQYIYHVHIIVILYNSDVTFAIVTAHNVQYNLCKECTMDKYMHSMLCTLF